MAQMGRPGLSAGEKKELWERWRAGESLSDIGRALGKHAGSIHGVVAAHGGFSPPERRRSPRSLSLSEREEISRGVAAGLSIRAIAVSLGRPPSTVSRELNRNGGRFKYRAAKADELAWKKARRPKQCKLAKNDVLRRVVAQKLSNNWSPEQISGWLAVTHPDEDHMHISHEAIYRSLFIQARGVLKKELMAHLRSHRLMRRSKQSTTKGQPRGQIIGGVSIRKRPAEVEDRAVPGHWEGDLVSGSKNTHIATLVERSSRYVIMVQVDGKDTQSVVSALIRETRYLPKELRRSLTWDRGTEMASHKLFTLATEIDVYFCDPQSPWQRGTNENTNRLIRQYLPRRTDLSGYSQQDLNDIALSLNQRPRKTLNFRTPGEVLHESVALTG